MAHGILSKNFKQIWVHSEAKEKGLEKRLNIFMNNMFPYLLVSRLSTSLVLIGVHFLFIDFLGFRFDISFILS